MFSDFRFGLRQIRRNPWFSLAAILTLALGIGATTLIFSVTASLLLTPFPYRDASRLVNFQVHVQEEAGVRGYDGVSEFRQPQFQDLVTGLHTMEGLVGFRRSGMFYRNGDGAEQVQAAWVTTNTFPFLGVAPQLGRALQHEDESAGASPVCVVSRRFWQEHFRSDPRALGTTMVLDGEPRTLVGVMPERFQFLGVAVWLPYSLGRTLAKQPRYLQAIGRLRGDATLPSAAADFDASLHRLAAAYPQDFPGKHFAGSLQTLTDAAVGRLRTLLYVLFAAVGLLLLIACSNVANLLLVRAAAREKEIAIRASVGATQWRLVRQLLVETGLIAVAAGSAGCWLAWMGLRGVENLLPIGVVPAEAVFRLDSTALGFALLITLFTSLLTGLAPALHAARGQIIPGAQGGKRVGSLRNILVVTEVSLAIVLLVGAGLMMRTFFALVHVDLGFDPANTLRAQLIVPRTYSTPERQKAFSREVLDRITALPGVTAAAFTMERPATFGGQEMEVDVSGSTQTGSWKTLVQYCSESYFRALRRPMRSGRGFLETDLGSPRQVTVVNEAFARTYLRDREPVGRRIRLHFEGMMGAPDNPEFEVVGVVADARNNGIREPVSPQAYLPITAVPGLVVRTAGPPLAIVDAIRRGIWTVDPNAALTGIETIEKSLEDSSYAQPRFGLIGIGGFAVVGLALAIVGVFSVMAFSTAARTREIGIRMALGAQSWQILNMVLAKGLKLIALGIGIGLVASLAATRWIAHELWGVSPTDPWTFAVVAFLLAAAGVAACYIPARRAARIQPIQALHEVG